MCMCVIIIIILVVRCGMYKCVCKSASQPASQPVSEPASQPRRTEPSEPSEPRKPREISYSVVAGLSTQSIMTTYAYPCSSVEIGCSEINLFLPASAPFALQRQQRGHAQIQVCTRAQPAKHHDSCSAIPIHPFIPVFPLRHKAPIEPILLFRAIGIANSRTTHA